MSKKVIIYDIQGLPNLLTAEQIVNIAETFGFVFWDSNNYQTGNPIEPKIVEYDSGIEFVQEPKILDINKEEIPEEVKQILK